LNAVYLSNLLVRFTRQIYLSDLLVGFTHQIYSSDLLIGFTHRFYSWDLQVRLTSQIYKSDLLVRFNRQIYWTDLLVRLAPGIVQVRLSFDVRNSSWLAKLKHFRKFTFRPFRALFIARDVLQTDPAKLYKVENLRFRKEETEKGVTNVQCVVKLVLEGFKVLTKK
jgi:hypothetical protein